jgi:FlaA1/EpsC-like NDP-sugar epimerase
MLGTLISDRQRVAHPEATPALIYGAGDGGEWLLRELANNAEHRYRVVGFLDDDPMKVGKIIRGCRIYAPGDAPRLVERHGVRDVLVSSGSIPAERLRSLRSRGVHLLRMRVSFEDETLTVDAQAATEDSRLSAFAVEPPGEALGVTERRAQQRTPG